MSIITIHHKCIEKSFASDVDANLLSFLRENGYSINAPCGGNGLCGKCKVKLKDDMGERIVSACCTSINSSCEVWLPDEAADLSWNESFENHSFESGRTGFGCAVDLGTTTVAVSLFSLSDGKSIGSASRWNAQESFGADVITRISHCIDNENGLETLSGIIRSQILDMLNELCKEHEVPFEEVKEIFLAGNTVMQHIFAGISPISIASAPFTPLSLFDDNSPVMLGKIPVFMSPCVAGYVGGDITAGILSTAISSKNTKSLFIDVGTNGEMVVGSLSSITACAVASGPAFEGAGISCGMPASYGAVNRVDLLDGRLIFEVIGGGEAKGICGSGLLDLISCLLELGYIDESGYLEESFYLTDKIYINQRDIRQLQLAKAAVSAGIKLLMNAEKLSFEDIDNMYLAGGFGNKLRPESAVRIGMLPAEMLGRIKTSGNTSLSGAEICLLNPSRRNELIEIKNKCNYIELSSEPAFNDCFVDEMAFPED